MGTLLNDLEPDEDDNGDGDWIKTFVAAYIIGMLIAVALMGALIWLIAKLIVS